VGFEASIGQINSEGADSINIQLYEVKLMGVFESFF
jgi:hypothetical protein